MKVFFHHIFARQCVLILLDFDNMGNKKLSQFDFSYFLFQVIVNIISYNHGIFISPSLWNVLIFCIHFLLGQKLADFFLQRDRDKYFGLRGHISLFRTTQSCHDSMKSAIDNLEINEHECIPIQLYMWTLKFKFNVIFMCRNVIDFYFFNHLKNLKQYLSCRPYKNTYT